MIDTNAIATAMVEQLTPTIANAITAAVATTTRGYYHQQIESAIGAEITAAAKRIARTVVARLDADPDLIDALTATCRAGLIEGARRGAEEQGAKIGMSVAKAAATVQQLQLVAR